MTEGKIDALFLNGIRDSGTVDVLQATPFGKLQINTDGSCNVANYLPTDTINISRFVIDHLVRQEIDVKHILKHDVVFCDIFDPDSHSVSLKKAGSLYDALHDKISWINNPHKVNNTRREKVPELLSDIEGVIAPRVMRINPGSADDIKATIRSSGMSLPVLLRPAGSHGGKNLVQIKNFDDLNTVDISTYAEAFVTEFIDFGCDGIYSKYRFAVVAGEPLLRHVLSNDHWMVHAAARKFMLSKPELRESEAEIIKNFDRGLKLEVQNPIREIHERIELDLFGIDCAIKDGQLIIFEVNANMNFMSNNQPLPNIWEGAVDRIRNSIIDRLLLKRIQSPR